jgi:YggT family protein
LPVLRALCRGVDVSPIVWVALISFMNEILLGKQGLLVLLSQKVA